MDLSLRIKSNYLVKIFGHNFVSEFGCMTHNGPAIKRAERLKIARWAILANAPACREGVLPNDLLYGPGTLAEKLSRWQDRYGVLFAVFARRSLGEGGHGTIFIACWRALPTVAERRWGRGTKLLSGREFLPMQKLDK
jgi:hypothetical protein